MSRNLLYVVIGIIAVGIILLNTNNTVKYLTCEDPSDYTYVIESINSDELEITFETSNSTETFSDYVYHIDNGILYIGVKYSLNPLSNDENSRYTTTIELTEVVNEIILKGASNQLVIYPE